MYINKIIDEYDLGDIVDVNIRSMFPERKKLKILKNVLLYGSPDVCRIKLAYKSESVITLTVFKTWTGYQLHYFHLLVPTYFERYHQENICSTLDQLERQINDAMFSPEEMISASPPIKSGYKR